MAVCYQGVLEREHVFTHQKSYLLSIDPLKWINLESHAKLFNSIQDMFDAERQHKLTANKSYIYRHLGKYPYEC
jgi:hypothetical protein